MSQRESIKRFLDSWEFPVNDEQLDVICKVHDDPSLVVVGEAVPGSGKTTMLVAAIHYLMHGPLKIPVRDILNCTFNTDCAEATRQRLAKCQAGNPMAFKKLSRTCHSVGWEICRNMGYNQLVEHADEILTETCKQYAELYGNIGMDKQEVAFCISFAKNRGAYVMPNGLDVVMDAKTTEALNVDFDVVAGLLKIYEKIKGPMVDFDDQLAIPAKFYGLFKAGYHPDNPYALFKNIRYLFLDELQDFNTCQMTMVEGLKEVSGCKVIGVGDRDQCVIEGTMITTGDGQRIPVEELVPESLVRSTTDGLNKIKTPIGEIHKNQYAGDIIAIVLEDGRWLGTTPEHNHFVMRPKPDGNYIAVRQCAIHDAFSRAMHAIDIQPDVLDQNAINEFRNFVQSMMPKDTLTYENASKDNIDFMVAHWSMEELQGILQHVQTIFPGLPLVHRFGDIKLSMQIVHASEVTAGDIMLDESGEQVMVSHVRRRPYKGYIYDLNVPGTFNYAANGIFTHNSIYGWRGANAHNIEVFAKTFNAEIMPVPMNYRSGVNILKAASAVIARTPGRENYNIVAGRKNAEGRVVEVNCSGPFVESKALVQIVQSLMEDWNPRNIFVLGRTNAALGDAARSLHFAGIPVTARLDEYQNEYAQILNCIAAVIGHKNTNMRTALKFVKLIGEKRALRLTTQGVDLEDVDPSAVGSGVISRKVSNLLDVLKRLREKHRATDIRSDVTAFQEICFGVRDALMKFTDEFARSTAMNLRSELNQVTQRIVDMGMNIGPMDTIDRLYEFEDVDLAKERLNCIELMTAHRAKGLEKEVVIIIDGDNFPCGKIDEADEMYHQESNLLFVAMTRAKELLVVLRYPKKNFGGLEEGAEWRTSEFYDKVPWTSSVHYGTKEMQGIFPPPSNKAMRRMTSEPGVVNRSIKEWPKPVKEFETGDTWDQFKDGVFRKLEGDGMPAFTCQPKEGWHDPAQWPKNFGKMLTDSLGDDGLKYLCDIYPSFMNKSIKPEEDRYKLQASWLRAASIRLATKLGPGWRPSIFRRRTWLKYLTVQKDVLLRVAPGNTTRPVTETYAVASLVFTMTGHPRIKPMLYLKVSRARFAMSLGAPSIASFLRFECMPSTGPMPMLLWTHDKDYAKSMKKGEGFGYALADIEPLLDKVREHEVDFDAQSNDLLNMPTPEITFNGHLWVFSESDMLWPIHSPDVLLVDHMAGKLKDVFDPASGAKDDALFDNLRQHERPRRIQDVIEHRDLLNRACRSLKNQEMEAIVARLFTVQSSLVGCEATGKKLQFTIERSPMMTVPNIEAEDAMSELLGRPVKFRVM